MIPIILKLRKQAHKDIARAQDLIVMELYKVFEKAVLHGGTAIWKCYKGNRFSEDVDAYIVKDIPRLEAFFDNLKKSGFIIHKKKIGQNSLYSNMEYDRLTVRFEALFVNKFSRSILKDYETCDGNYISVYCVSAEDLVKEKVSAYLTRRKIRDLYDIYFLMKHADRISIKKSLNELVRNFKEPVDENVLKILILEGIAPSTKKMLDYIKRG